MISMGKVTWDFRLKKHDKSFSKPEINLANTKILVLWLRLSCVKLIPDGSEPQSTLLFVFRVKLDSFARPKVSEICSFS